MEGYVSCNIKSSLLFFPFLNIIITILYLEESSIFKILHKLSAAAKSVQSCPTLCDPIDSRPPGSSVHGIFQARVLEWGAIAFSEERVRQMEKVALAYTLMSKLDSWWEVAIKNRVPSLLLCDNLGGGGGEEGSRRRGYLYIYGWFTLLYGRNQ